MDGDASALPSRPIAAYCDIRQRTLMNILVPENVKISSPIEKLSAPQKKKFPGVKYA